MARVKIKKPTKELMHKVLVWFATGRVGSSSKCMATYLTTEVIPPYGDYPHDPDDLNRCLLLLEAVPELRDYLPQMANVNKQWKELVDNWDALESCFINEVGLNWCKGSRAPITYKAMKQMGC
ncbi:hypothetical protein NVP1201B_64 [Vibrio phage 1.201.B._10N.286.55.F1]|nr:hypothetical protein NVP1201B_64 [Vibrio phage 1.201.B._10N.286.55.F1]